MIERYVFVIEPNKEIQNTLNDLKEKFNDLSNNDYIKHPNHITLFHGLIEKSIIEKEAKKIKFKKFNLRTNKIELFEDDKITNSSTLYLSLIYNPELIELQKYLLSKFSLNINNEDLKNLFKENKEYLNNLNLFNYPYVGKDWIPHFTICSLDFHANNERVSGVLDQEFKYEMIVEKIAVYLFKKNLHTKVAEITL